MSRPGGDPHTRTKLPADESSGGEPRRPRPLRSLCTVLGVLALLLGAIMIANRGTPDPKDGKDHADSTDATKPSTDPTRPTGSKPVDGTDPDTGLATGYPHTKDGAQSAATNYSVALGSSDMFVDDRRKALLHTLSAPSAQDSLLARTDRSFPRVRKNLELSKDGKAKDDQTFVCRSVPIGTKLTSYSQDDGTATVSVWNSTLFGLAGKGSTTPVTGSWNTTVLHLAWTHDDWKVTDFEQKDGPAPVRGDDKAAGADDIAKAVREYGGYRYAR